MLLSMFCCGDRVVGLPNNVVLVLAGNWGIAGLPIAATLAALRVLWVNTKPAWGLLLLKLNLGK